MKLNLYISYYFRWTYLSILCGLLAGFSTSVFLSALDWMSHIRDKNSMIIWALPLAGFFIGWIYHKFGNDVAEGTDLIIEEINQPKKIIPTHMAPFILFGTLLTHLFGGSAGREGTAVQMGASLSDQISRIFKISAEDRKILLTAGASAGFGAAIGAPWAGMIFGMEMINVGRLRLYSWYQSFIASMVGYYFCVLLDTPHSVFPDIEIPDYNAKILFFVVIAGVAFGLAAKFFSMSTYFIKKLSDQNISYSPLKPFLGGLLLVSIFYFEGSYDYVGLGIYKIQNALTNQTGFHEPLLKSLLTSITIGTGFKGGEFIPLVFIGTTLGSALSAIIPVSVSLLAALGFAAVFAGASNTPIACTIMAMELFGPKIGLFAFATCSVSYFFSGYPGIYKSQKNKELKSSFLNIKF